MRRSSSPEAEIFRQGSTTYYWSSRFFPGHVREDVFKLYSFVRVVDNCVDAVPSDLKGFAELKQLWATQDYASASQPLYARVVQNMYDVADKYDFDPAWAEAFLASMRMDVERREYMTIDDTLEYVYGSAEVIGLMMAKILGLPEESFEAARLQGRAMQWINFLRDIAEDNELGRCYVPREDLDTYGLHDLSVEEAERQPEAFAQLMRYELQRYNEWQTAANNGFQYIPRRLLAPLRTAVDMYNWTAGEIAKDPMIVFQKKVKPQPQQVMARGLKNLLSRTA